MQESLQAALEVTKNIAPFWKKRERFFEKHDIHIHVPEGATPKDGPSAGITMCVAIHLLCLINHSTTLAMTGEITLAGKVSKLEASKRNSLLQKEVEDTNVIIPKRILAILKK